MILYAFVIIYDFQLLIFSINSIYFSKSFNFNEFVYQKTPVTADSVRYFIENNPKILLKKYKKLTPCLNPVEYQTILPFHEDGTSKKDINYFDYFDCKNVAIKHFSSYLNHLDKYEKSRQVSQILKYKETNNLRKLSLKKFTILYLIIVSSPTSNIIREIKAMEKDTNDEVAFILFIDNKSNRTRIYNLFESEIKNKSAKLHFKNVYFIDSPRFHIGWSKITLSLSEAVLMKAAIKYFPNSLYLSIHSESDYPLIPNKYIIQYFKSNYPKNYIALNNLSMIADWKLIRPKIFHLSSKINYKYMKMIHYLFPKRSFPSIVWQFGSNWFTITLKDSKKLIQEMINQPIFIDFLEYSFISDENIFQTLVVEANISTTQNTHRYINWNTNDGHPKTFDINNFDELIRNKCNFWARKFTARNKDLLDKIDSYIDKLSKSNNDKLINNCK